nr:immunoglobulin heavy chain junction region [Mus musculus]
CARGGDWVQYYYAMDYW